MAGLSTTKNNPQKSLSSRAFFLGLICIGVILYSVPVARSEVEKLLSYNACDIPISYTLGSIDARFKLSAEDALGNIQKAADIWNHEYTKPLFVYSPQSKLKVSFVYDERTALNEKIYTQQNQLDQRNTALQKQIDAYDADVAAFEKKLAAFNARVDQANRAGNVSEDEYNALVSEQNALKAERDSLNTRADQLNIGARNFNANLSDLKNNMNEFNEKIVQKPEEGLYNPTENTIAIYFVVDKNELVHTLAHELGHARALEHTEDKSDIMYPSSSKTLTVTPNDKAQLDYVCREQSLISHWLEVTKLKLYLLLRNLSSEASLPSPASQ